MSDWIIYVLIPLITALIGGLVGVIFTIKWENQQKEKEKIDNAKPIIINYMGHQAQDNSRVARYFFESKDDTIYGNINRQTIYGVFKNTNNGILFIDYIETGVKEYYPFSNATVDRNTAFYIVLQRIYGETLTKCIIHCHDIYNTAYCYNAHFCFDDSTQSQIIIDDNQPVLLKKDKNKRR